MRTSTNNNKSREIRTFIFSTVRKKLQGDITEREKQWVLKEALAWERKRFKEDGCEYCDRYDDFTPRFSRCDTFAYEADVIEGVNGKFGGIFIIGTIANKIKLRNFLESAPPKLPSFTPSDYGFDRIFLKNFGED